MSKHSKMKSEKMSKRAKEKAELIANGILISVQGKTGRVVYNTKEKSFTHYELMCAAQKGYEQAEKDLALTWEDIRSIIELYERRKAEDAAFDACDYEALLYEFNEQKKK